MPKISIIMGVFNAEKRMSTAIMSIVNQSYSDWEFIICDDGSSDDTYLHLLEWKRKDCRIIPIQNSENKGLAAALNHCIEKSKGKFIARMDDDDYSYPERLSVLLNFLESHQEYSFVSSQISIYDGEKVNENYQHKKIKPKKEDFLFSTAFVHPATMFRADDLKKIGGYRVSKETRRAEDYDLFMRMYADNLIGYNFPKVLYQYYINPDIVKQKRKYAYRIDEMIVRYKGFKIMGLLPKAWPYVMKPLVVGLMPISIIERLKRKKNECEN